MYSDQYCRPIDPQPGFLSALFEIDGTDLREEITAEELDLKIEPCGGSSNVD